MLQDWSYARMSRDGSGRRASSVNSDELMLSPRYDGNDTPSIVSRSSDRGFANCPAILPSFTTGTPAPYINTTDI